MTAPYRSEIEAAARAHGVDADLLEALVAQESGYQADAFRYEPAFFERYLKHNPAYAGDNPRRVSSSYGLCQVMYPTAVDHGFHGQPEYLFLPNVNLDYGARILAELLTWAKGDRALALGAYNAGRGAAHGQAGAMYARSVLKRFDAIKAARGQA